MHKYMSFLLSLNQEQCVAPPSVVQVGYTTWCPWFRGIHTSGLHTYTYTPPGHGLYITYTPCGAFDSVVSHAATVCTAWRGKGGGCGKWRLEIWVQAT